MAEQSVVAVPVAAAPQETPTPPVLTAADRRVSTETLARLERAVPPATRRAYTRQWQRWTAWCAQQGRTPLPATAESLAEYVAHLTSGDRPAAPATVEQALAAIRTRHRAAGYADRPDTTAARLLLRAYRRRRAHQGLRARQAPPIGIDELRAMVAAADPDTPAGLRDRVLLVLGLALMARRSELVALDWADLTETTEGLVVCIRTSKTDKESRGADVAVPYGTHPDTCPVRLVRAWRDLLAAHGVTDGPVLRSVDRHGRIGDGLTGDGVNRIVRAAAARAGLPNPERYSAHSLRAGGATAAYRAGAPVSTIASHGRWAPGSPVVLSYVRAVDRWSDNPLRNIGL